MKEVIGENLIFRYTTLTNNNKEKVVTLTTKEFKKMKKNIMRKKNETEKNLQDTDLTLSVLQPENTEVKNDISCDSLFMMKHIQLIRREIWKAHPHVQSYIHIYLWMDNVWGHGKDQIKDEYLDILKNEFNILIEWQIANSHELNMLDLGMFMALQSLVESKLCSKVIDKRILSELVEDS